MDDESKERLCKTCGEKLGLEQLDFCSYGCAAQPLPRINPTTPHSEE